MCSKTIRIFGVAALQLALLTLEPLPASGALRMGFSAISGTQSIAWIAKEEGFFKKHGLDVELIYTRGGAANIQTLLAGEQTVSQVGGASPISAMLRGADLVFFALLVPKFYYDFVVSPEIKSFADLKGKKIAMSGFGNITHIATILLLNKHGLVPNKDVAMVRVGGGGAEAWLTLASGGIQAAMLPAPFNLQAIKGGAHRLSSMKNENIAFPLNTLVARRTDLSNNRGDYIRILRACIEATAFLKSNKDRSLNVLKKYTRITDRASLELAYDEALNTVDDPYVHEDIIQGGLQLIGSINNQKSTLQAAAVIDNSILEEIRSRGASQK